MEQFLHLVNEMSPYLLLGFLLAGLMHAFIPGRFYTRYLSAGKFSSVINAALFGIPLPLCSCGVIPTAMSLRKEGASKGAVVSFLIATPQTGIDSILATYGLMGLPFAIVRPLAALATSLLGGGATLAFDKDTANATHCACDDTESKSFGEKLKEAIIFGFVEMMQDIGKWLIVGLAAAALITICIPTEWFAAFQGNTLASMILVLCIAIPMYLCATGSIPIAVALMMKGLTPGAALVLLMAGPACNLASVLVIRKVLGTRTLIIYLLSIVVGAVGFGSLIDYLQFNGIVGFLDHLVMTDSCCEASASWFEWACSALLGILLFYALVIKRGHHHHHHHHDGDEHHHHHHTDEPKTNDMRTFHIEGMNCNHCRMSAEKAILSVAGITSATVDLQSGEAQVEGTATSEAVIKAVEEIGFKCHE